MIKCKQYNIEIKDEYIYILVQDYKKYYQLKLEDEGLVLDVINPNPEDKTVEVMESLCHCLNDEVLEEE